MTVELVLNKHMKGRGEGEDVSNRSSKAVSAKIWRTSVSKLQGVAFVQSRRKLATSNAGQVTAG